MKNLFKILVLLLLANNLQAQIVNIPDANFKAALIANGVDTNVNGEVDTFETNLVSTLFVSGANISNLIGIEAFTNLNILYCDNNNLTFLDISSNLNLTFLSCRQNQIAFLNLNNNPNLTDVLADSNQLNGINMSNNSSLEVLWVANNNLTALNTSSCSSLRELWCDNNHVTSLNLVNSPNLLSLDCANNLLTSINVTGLGNLSSINCITNQLTILDLSSCTNLNILYCEANQLTTLNLTGLANLHTVSCGYNQLSDIDVSSSNNTLSLFYLGDNNLSALDLSGFNNLIQLVCINNQITSLNITNCTNLNLLSCGGNQLTSLNLGSELTSLSSVYCIFNQLTTLDVSNLPNLTSLDCSNNPLTTLFMKNGSSATELFFVNTPSLEFICCDEFEMEQVQTLLNSYGNTTCVINTYCTFTPGGNYNTVTGTIRFDENNNGCDSTDTVFPNFRLDMTQWGNNSATMTNANGLYTFYTSFIDVMITPNLENPSYFTVSPENILLSFHNPVIENQDFCIVPNGIHNDVEVVIAPVFFARPGFDASYKITYKNKGNQTLSGSVNLTFEDDKIDFVSANPIVNNLQLNTLTWNYNNLLPFESRTIYLTLNVNSPTETPAVNIGDILHFTAVINPITGDVLPDDNTFTYNETVVGSFDPNNIECLEGDSIAPSYIGEFLHYGVNFENTGTFYAENIVVKIIIDTTKYDMNSLQLLNTSHNAYTRISNNMVEFIFETINLDSGGHGNILFKIKTLNNLVSGDMVAKRADIFFDYNAPIDTGVANTTFQSLSNGGFEIDNSVSIYPNPTKANVAINVNQNDNNKIKSVSLYDVQGRILQTQIIDNQSSTLDISEKSNGIYFLKVTTDKGIKVEKIVKE